MKCIVKMLTALAVVSPFLSACSEESSFNSPSNGWTEDRVRESLQFSSPLSLKSIKGEDNVGTTNIGIRFRLNRPSTGCRRGFGLCDPTVIPDSPYDQNKPWAVKSNSKNQYVKSQIKYDSVNQEYFSFLYLGELPNPEIPLESLSMQIDDYLVIPFKKDKDLYVHPCTIKYDKNIGRFGGYKIVYSEIEPSL